MGLCPSASVPGLQSQLPGPGGVGFRSSLRPVDRAVGLDKGMRRLLLVGLSAVALGAGTGLGCMGLGAGEQPGLYVGEAEGQEWVSAPDVGWPSTSLPPCPAGAGLTPRTWLMVTVRLSAGSSSGVVTARPPCSACRRSSWISCGGPGSARAPKHRGQTPAGHQEAEAPRHRVPKTLRSP